MRGVLKTSPPRHVFDSTLRREGVTALGLGSVRKMQCAIERETEEEVEQEGLGWQRRPVSSSGGRKRLGSPIFGSPSKRTRTIAESVLPFFDVDLDPRRVNPRFTVLGTPPPSSAPAEAPLLALQEMESSTNSKASAGSTRALAYQRPKDCKRIFTRLGPRPLSLRSRLKLAARQIGVRA
jgi:hypothetical protein